MPGPAPKPADQRVRRNKVPGTITLPAEGRVTAAGKAKPAPAWPLGVDVQLERDLALAKLDLADAEFELEMITTARERAAVRKRVATRRRRLLELQETKKLQRSEESKLWRDLWRTPQATQWEKLAWTRGIAQYVRHKVKAEGGSLDDAREAVKLEDRLGLNPLALLRLRWEIADGDAAARPSTRQRSKQNSRYAGLKVVG